MAERVRYTCDICGVEKQDSNHWWEIAIFDKTTPLQLFAWENRLTGDSTWKKFHLCGHACVLRKVNEYLSQPAQQPQWTPDGPIFYKSTDTEEPK